MHRDHGMGGHYTGPDRRKLERRKMLLKEDDIGVIKGVVTQVVDERMIGHCRYEIEPADMKDLMAFVRVFQQGAMDIKGATRSLLIKKVIPRVILGTLLTILADYLGLLRPILNVALKAMKGGG
jgi:hypothetical protein